MSTSSKRKTSDTEDGDTRQVVVMKKRRDTSTPPPTPSSSASATATYPDYVESPPASQAAPWETDDDDDDDNDDFKFSPTSPLTQSTQREEETAPPPPPTLYVFPESSVLLTADGGAVRIPDRSANQPESSTQQREESPEPSTSHTYNSEDTPEVCEMMIEEAVSNLITYTWRKSTKTIDELTKTICEDITAIIMSQEWHELMNDYVRISIRRPQ